MILFVKDDEGRATSYFILLLMVLMPSCWMKLSGSILTLKIITSTKTRVFFEECR